MTKIRMNTELRNKLFNKIKNVFENEDTQEREAFLQARESVDHHYKYASELAKLVVERSYPVDDVATLRTFKKKYGSPCDVVAKAMDCNPDIYAQQNENKDNPHKTKHVDACSKALGYTGTYHNNDHTGMTKSFNDQYYLDVIGTSYCRSRAIACTKDEYTEFENFRIAKGNLVTKHQTWIDTIMKQCDQLKIGLKAYRYLSEGIELATELGIQVDEAELIRTNSTGLTIYNPSNLASMIKGMKNKHQSREAKILARKKYEESIN